MSCWCGWDKKKRSVLLCFKERGGGKENSLVLFYVVCVQLEQENEEGSGGVLPMEERG